MRDGRRHFAVDDRTIRGLDSREKIFKWLSDELGWPDGLPPIKRVLVAPHGTAVTIEYFGNDEDPVAISDIRRQLAPVYRSYISCETNPFPVDALIEHPQGPIGTVQ